MIQRSTKRTVSFGRRSFVSPVAHHGTRHSEQTGVGLDVTLRSRPSASEPAPDKGFRKRNLSRAWSQARSAGI